MAATKKDVHPEGNDLEGKTLKNETSAGKDSEGSTLKVKTSQGTALENAAKPAGRAAPERRYTVACAALGVLTAVGLAACLIFRDEWGTALFFLPLGAVITALLWCSFARLCLCRDPARLLSRNFTRALRRAMEIPLWAGVTALLCLLPAEMPFDIAILILTMFLAAVPASVLLGILSVCSAVRHLRAAPASESAIYREGPLVLAVLLLIAELAALGWLTIYFLL